MPSKPPRPAARPMTAGRIADQDDLPDVERVQDSDDVRAVRELDVLGLGAPEATHVAPKAPVAGIDQEGREIVPGPRIGDAGVKEQDRLIER